MWVAYRDGDGAWQVLEGEARYMLELEHPEGRYSVAHVCAAGLDEGAGEEVAREVTVSLLHTTLAAHPSVPTPCADETEDGTEKDFYALSGIVKGLEAGETALVYSAFLADAVTADAPGYSLAGFTTGEHDLLVTVQQPAQETPSAEATPPSKVLVRRGVAVKGDETLDLDLSRAIPTTFKRVDVTDVTPGSEVSSSLSLVTERGTSGALGAIFSERLDAEAFSFDYAALPALPEGTTYRLSVESFSEDAQGQRLSTSLERTFMASEDLALSLPETLGMAELSSDGGRPTLTWSAYREGADYTLVFESSDDDAGETRYLVALGAAWLPPGARDLRYTLPDLSDLPGWGDTWELRTDLFWSLSARAERENEVVTASRSSALPETD